MALQFEATYENGVLKPATELPLQEGEKVTVSIQPKLSPAERFCGSIPWTGDPEELEAYLNDPDEGIWGASRDVQ
jgi:predicted DNA-binding antitoxin AbrB/MazE fold protein